MLTDRSALEALVISEDADHLAIGDAGYLVTVRVG